MAKQAGQGLKLIAVLDILRRYSDEEHPLNAAELCERLAAFGISAERKAIYNDIELLIAYGYDIVKCSTPKKGCFLASREFELPELYLLADAVRAAKFISPKKTRDLVSKLDAMLSVYQVRQRERGIFFDASGKCDNDEIYYTIDAVSRAINQKRKIRLRYTVRTLSENRTVVNQTRERIISPYALTWQDDHYYLIGNYEKYDNLIHLRVDRMRSVELLTEESRPFCEVCEYRDFFDVADYTKRLFHMHGGEMAEVELRCDRSMTEQVIDRFGESVFIRKVTHRDFCFTVRAALSEALVTWILNYGSSITVLAPEALRERVIGRAQSVLSLYRHDGSKPEP